MALELDPANAYSLPVRWGDLFRGVNALYTFANTDVATLTDRISNDYLTLSQQGEVIDDLYTEAKDVAGDLGDFAGYLFGLVETTLERMCLDDTARPRSNDVAGYFDKLDRDLRAADRKWTIPTVSGTVAVPGTNIGDGYLVGSVVEPVDGQTCYYALAETIRLECTSDSYGNATEAGAEEWSVDGEVAVEFQSADWPKGSGAATTLTVAVPGASEEVTDGDFDEWTATNTPTNWSLLTGTVAGTHVFQEADTSKVYTTDSQAVRFEGDGATAGLGIYQELDQEVVTANTNYAVSVWYRSGATSVVTGADLRIALTNGSGTVITDNMPAQSITGTTTNGAASVTGLSSTASLRPGLTVTGTGIAADTTIASVDSSTAITLSQNATASGTVSLTFTSYQSGVITTANFTDADATWTRKTVVLRTPRNLPTELRLELKFTGTLIDDASSETKKVWIDRLTMSPMAQVYDGGPYLALHGGNTPFATKDAFTYAVANTGDETTFVGSINRAFDLAGNGIRLTVTGTTALNNNLITG